MNFGFRFSALLLPFLFLGALMGCDSGGGSATSIPNPTTPSVYTENDFTNDPTLRIPLFHTAVMFLEPPNEVQTTDTHEAGTDAVPYYAEALTECRFCWEDPVANAQHTMVLWDSAGNEVLSVVSNEACVTATIGAGNYTMFLVHDGLTIDTHAIFITTDSGGEDGGIQSQYNENQVNLLVSSRKCVRCDLTGANLSYANLYNADLTGAHLSNADLTGANLTGAHLSNADLTGANLSYANLYNANLTGANLTGAHLSNAYLSNANLTDADLTGADLTDAHLSWAYLSGADLSGAYLSGTDLTKAYLSGANLSGANLSGADLSWADLTGANLTGANLSGANLSGVIWTDGRICAEGSIGSCD